MAIFRERCRAQRPLEPDGQRPPTRRPWSAPSMLNIEHLRKQAKLYLRWHREHYYPVAARIRAVLPRYSRLTDPEILEQSFQLSDAQELVARTVSFESW